MKMKLTYFVKSRIGATVIWCFAMLLWFVVDWSIDTTFRSLGIWNLWVNNLLAAFILSFPFVATRKIWVQGLVLLLVFLIMEANLMYSRTYLTGIPPESYLLASNLADFTDSVRTSIRWRDGIFIVILVCGYFGTKYCETGSKRYDWRIWGMSTLALGAVSFISMAAQGGFFKSYDDLRQSAYYSSCGVPVYTIAGHIAYHLMDSEGSEDQTARVKIEGWIEQHERNNSHLPKTSQQNARRNLVIILLESFETWPLEKEIDGMPITPFLDSLINLPSTLYVPNVLTQVGAGRSIDAQLLITAGLLPPTGQVFSSKYPDNTFPTLNKALREKYGTKSALFTVDKPITWNMGVVARNFGYDMVFDRNEWTIDEKIGNPAKLSDGSFFRQAVDLINTSKVWPENDPAMITFVTYSGHSPFRLPKNFRDPGFNVHIIGMNEVLADYITMAHYTDSQLHTLIKYLQSRADKDETLIVITGDHEGLGAWRKEITKEGKSGSELLDMSRHTPLIILNAPEGGRIDHEIGQIDIYPTLLSMLGLNDFFWQGIGTVVQQQVQTDTIGNAPGGSGGGTRQRICDLIFRTDYFSDL